MTVSFVCKTGKAAASKTGGNRSWEYMTAAITQGLEKSKEHMNISVLIAPPIPWN